MFIHSTRVAGLAALLPLALFVNGVMTLRTNSVLQSARSSPYAVIGEKQTFDKLYSFMQNEVETGFTHRTNPSQFREKFDRMTDIEDACSAQFLSRALTHDAGFGSRVNGFFGELMVALYGGYSLSLCANPGPTDFVASTWLKYFNTGSLHVCNNTEVCATGENYSRMSLARLGRKVQHCLANHTGGDRKYLMQFRHFIAKHAFRLNGQSAAKIRAILQTAGLREGDEYIGVHIRHGDKWHETELLPTSTYGEAVVNYTHHLPAWLRSSSGLAVPSLEVGMEVSNGNEMQLSASRWEQPAPKVTPRRLPQERENLGLAFTAETIRHAAERAGVRKVFVASDDPRAYQDLRAHFGNELTVLRQPPTTDKIFGDRTYNDDLAILSLLTDIVALMHSKIFIGTASSNIGELVYYLRGVEESISLDSDGDWMEFRRCYPFTGPDL